MSRSHPYQKLVAIDWNDRGDLAELLRRLTGAVVDVHVEAASVERPTRPPADKYIITFDTRRMRNTVAHGHGYYSGFVVHIEP